MIKMIVSDLDGTLLNYAHSSDKLVFEAIDLALENNIVFVVATGRAILDNGESLGLADKDIYIISNNGAIIKDGEGNVLYQKQLPKEFIKDTLEKFPHFAFDLITLEDSLVNASEQVYRSSFKAERFINRTAFRLAKKRFTNYFIKGKRFEVPIDELINYPIVKMNCRVPNEADKQAYLEHINQYPSVMNLPFSNRIFEVTDKEVNKGMAVTFLANHLNIPHNQVVVFGDGGNDAPMLEAFEHSYAPKNASTRTKRAAKEILGHYWFRSVPMKIIQLIKEEMVIENKKG